MPTQISCQLGNAQQQYSIEVPELCPICSTAIEPKILFARASSKLVPNRGFLPSQLALLMSCPREACQCAFITVYERNPNETNGGSLAFWTFKESAPRIFRARKFDERIEKLSPQFPIIFNESLQAETMGLDHICGPGYRKSLEFLVKDYLCAELKDGGEAETVRRTFLGPCISRYVSDPRIKSMAERAVWLGNDETHYVRKWDAKDVSDLKKLIDLTVHWIEVELLTRELEESMPKIQGA